MPDERSYAEVYESDEPVEIVKTEVLTHTWVIVRLAMLKLTQEFHSEQRSGGTTFHEYRFRIEDSKTMFEAMYMAEQEVIGELNSTRAYRSPSGNWIVTVKTIQHH